MKPIVCKLHTVYREIIVCEHSGSDDNDNNRQHWYLIFGLGRLNATMVCCYPLLFCFNVSVKCY